MNDQVRDAALRLSASLGLDADAQWFGSDECWALFRHLMGLMNEGRPLSSATLGFLEEFFIVLKVRGVEEEFLIESLEEQLGRCPYPLRAVVAVVRSVRAQQHFHRAEKQVELEPARRYVPLRSFKYG
jgi:hypothetical protein